MDLWTKLLFPDGMDFLWEENTKVADAPDVDALISRPFVGDYCRRMEETATPDTVAHAIGKGPASQAAQSTVFRRDGRVKRRRLGLYSASRTPSGLC